LALAGCLVPLTAYGGKKAGAKNTKLMGVNAQGKRDWDPPARWYETWF
jgi:hypothetical protein